MIKSKTVFVVGAGASAEVGLPIGNQLTTAVGALVTPTNDGSVPAIKDDLIRNALLQEIRLEHQAVHLELFSNVGNLIRKSMPLAPSIDNFLDAHRENSHVNLCGKLAIVRSILDAERKSKLWIDDRNVYNIIGFYEIAATWYVQFWKLLVTDIDKANVDKVFQNVAFITFNYDRRIEQFLFEALKVYYEIDKDRAADIMRTLTIHHPYGLIHLLPQLNTGTGFRFGTELRAQELRRSAEQIKTFTERVDEQVELKHIRETFANAEKIVFLGFAFHEINMRLLKPGTITKAEKVFGTVKGFSKPDREVIAERIRDVLIEDPVNRGSAEHSARRSFIRNDLKLNFHDGTCFELFREYSQSIGT